MAPIRILHSADWQVGKVFRNIPGDEGAALRLQRFAAVETVAKVARDRKVDAALVAGDVFESDSVSDDTLRRTLSAMAPYEGPWVLLPGNHDPALASSVWTRIDALGRPDNVILATNATPIALAGGRLAILPAPLCRKHEARDVTGWFDGAPTPDGTVRVGLAHGSIEGASAADGAAPNTIAADRADTARLDYLALGDWHSRREIGARTWYAGTPEADRFRSPDPGHVLIVTLEGARALPAAEPVRTGHYDWTRIALDIAGETAAAQVDDALAAIAGPDGDARRQVVRLILGGVLSLSERQAVEETIAGWRARFHVLDVRTSDLVAAPSDADLDAIDRQGFVRSAVERLKDQADAEPRDGEGAVAARRALQILWQAHAALRRGGG